LIIETLQIVRSEPTPAERKPVTDKSTGQFTVSPVAPVPPKKKMKKGTEDSEILEKAIAILTSSAATAASADDECRSFGNFIANKLRNYLPHTRSVVQHEISNIIFAADQGHFDVSCPVPSPSPASQVSSPTTPSSAAGSGDLK
jgi:hypothetical protein